MSSRPMGILHWISWSIYFQDTLLSPMATVLNEDHSDTSREDTLLITLCVVFHTRENKGKNYDEVAFSIFAYEEADFNHIKFLSLLDLGIFFLLIFLKIFRAPWYLYSSWCKNIKDAWYFNVFSIKNIENVKILHELIIMLLCWLASFLKRLVILRTQFHSRSCETKVFLINQKIKSSTKIYLFRVFLSLRSL